MNRIACPYCGSGPFELYEDEAEALRAVKCLRCRVVFSVAFLQDPAAVKRWKLHDRLGTRADVAIKKGRD